ncbi:MAG: DUF1735 and LamG domain-containing protein [Bacteroidetes bacterium]|nr:DUF1735 and LamG domain-containing protein [Bacteroidota bacterium]
MNLRYKFLLFAVALGVVFSVACRKYKQFDDVILVTGTENNNVIKFTVENTPASMNVTASATGIVTQDISVSWAVDTSLVAGYNSLVNGNYFVAPANAYTLSGMSGVIKAGGNVSDPITVKVVSTDSLKDGRSYLIPITIKSVTGPHKVLETSRTVFLQIARVTKFTSIDLSNYNFYDVDTFAKPITGITQFTFEIKCFVNSWHTGNPPISRLCNWGPADQTTFNLLRFGEAGSDTAQLQWINSAGGMFSNLRFAKNTWYNISCVCDGSNYKLYINGTLDNSFTATGPGFTWGALELGMSYAGYQNSQRFLGRTAEVRFWNRPLSQTEIQQNLCGADPSAPGLVSYWKMNEGSGQTFFDATGNGRNMVWTKAAVVWNKDSVNKCAQ